MSNGKSLHDSSKGFGPTRSILQRGIDKERPAQQSRDLGRQETCQPACLAHQRQNKTHQSRLTKQLRQFPGGMGAPGGPAGDKEEREEEEGDLVMGPIEQWLKRMIKGTPPTTKPHTTTTGSVKKKGQPSTSGSKIPVPKSKVGTPLTSQEEKDPIQHLEALQQRRKTLEKKISEASPWGKGKGKGALALKRLKPLSGWEDWAQGKKLKRRLDYDSA